MVKILQYGEGNFLRTFVDAYFDTLTKEGVDTYKVHIVKPITFGTLERFEKQNNKYHIVLRGVENGKDVENVYAIDALEHICVFLLYSPILQAQISESLLTKRSIVFYNFVIIVKYDIEAFVIDFLLKLKAKCCPFCLVHILWVKYRVEFVKKAFYKCIISISSTYLFNDILILHRLVVILNLNHKTEHST